MRLASIWRSAHQVGVICVFAVGAWLIFHGASLLQSVVYAIQQYVATALPVDVHVLWSHLVQSLKFARCF